MKLNAWQRAWIVASVIWVPIAIGFGIEQGFVPYAGPAVLRALAKDCTATLQRLSDEEIRANEEAGYRAFVKEKMFRKFTKEEYLAIMGDHERQIQTDEDCRELEGWGYSVTTLEAYHAARADRIAARADRIREGVIFMIALIIIPVIGVYVLVWLGYHTVRWILKGVW